MEVKLGKKIKCSRCGYVWLPRIKLVRVCPRCSSPYWDVPRGREWLKDAKEEREARGS